MSECLAIRRSARWNMRTTADPLVPRQQRFGLYTRSLMKGLGVPVENRWGLRPARAPAKAKPGRDEVIRAHGKTIENAIAGDPFFLAPLKLHYLRWVLFNIGSDTYFMYQGIFDTDFDKYTEDAVALFSKAGLNTIFENLEGFPMDWKTNPSAFVKFVREHQCPSFLEYGE
jgi:hypothetical protein